MEFPSIDRSFFLGDCFDAYRTLGAHPFRDGWRFAVWAPSAVAVEICGGFDGWGPGVPMQRAETGIWNGFVPGLQEGEMYKFRIHGRDGSTVMRADPYAFATELRPGTASILTKLDFPFDDHTWMERRDKCRNLPLNIYELHAGSWKHKPNATCEDGSDGWYNYRELARELIPWLLDHRFTHVELLPLAEHPFDGSWGYQTTGYFSVTSRYGSPADFAAFVNACHRMGIGVIMDFVPVHFAANGDALANFDGTHLYEYDSDVGHSEWGTCNFNYYRREVCSFLNSAAALWMDVYHCDGIRMDAISRALYWQGDPNRGVNEGAVTFLRNLNHGLNERGSPPASTPPRTPPTSSRSRPPPATTASASTTSGTWAGCTTRSTTSPPPSASARMPTTSSPSVCSISTTSCICWPSATTKSSTAKRPSSTSSGAPTRKSVPSCAPCTFTCTPTPARS